MYTSTWPQTVHVQHLVYTHILCMNVGVRCLHTYVHMHMHINASACTYMHVCVCIMYVCVGYASTLLTRACIKINIDHEFKVLTHARFLQVAASPHRGVEWTGSLEAEPNPMFTRHYTHLQGTTSIYI